MKTLRQELIDFMADFGFEGFTEGHVITQTVDNYLKRKKSINSAPNENLRVSKKEPCHHGIVDRNLKCKNCGKRIHVERSF